MNRLLQRGLVTIIGVSTLILPGTVLPAALHAQNDVNATVHGKVVDPGGSPFGRGEIKFSHRQDHARTRSGSTNTRCRWVRMARTRRQRLLPAIT